MTFVKPDGKMKFLCDYKEGELHHGGPCNHFKSSRMNSEIVPGEEFDVLQLNLRSKTFKSFV